MNDLGWQKVSVKWGGKDYSRSLWIRPGYAVTDGKVYGKGVDGDRIADHLAAKSPYGEVEIIE